LAEALGVPLSELVAENPSPSPQPANGRQLREPTAFYEVQIRPIEEVEQVFTSSSAPTGLNLKMTPELDALIRKHPEMEPLRDIIKDGRPWSELNREERRARAEMSRGILRWSPASVDDFLARKHAETAAEENKHVTRS
jgi:hypothetical protein